MTPNTADPPPRPDVGVEAVLRFDWFTARGRHIIMMPLPIGRRLRGDDDMVATIDEYQRNIHDHVGTQRGPNDPPAKSA
jgi:hypothetical protein